MPPEEEDRARFIWRKINPNPPDPAWMEYVLEEGEFDQEVKAQLLAAALETMAGVNDALAAGARQAAGIVRAAGGSGELST